MWRGNHFVLHWPTGMVSAGQLYSMALGYWVKSNYCSRYMVSNTKVSLTWSRCFSIFLQNSIWNQLMTFNLAIRHVRNLFLWIVRHKPIKAAQRSAETEFPLSETICWSESSPSTGSSCIPSEFTIGQSTATEQRQRHPEMGLGLSKSSAEKVNRLRL